MIRLRPPRRSWKRRLPVLLPLVLLGCLGLTVLLYRVPYVHERLGWRLTVARAEIKYALSPPEESVFTPDLDTIAQASSSTPSATPSATASATPQPGPTSTPTATATYTPTPTPVPDSVQLRGVVHEYQKYNNCGPASLSMALSYWGWEGDQRDTAAYLKPNPEDKNVMPYEMVDYVQTHTSLKALVRAGGDLEMVKRLVAGGFPPILEMGYEPPEKSWMGHYELTTGYDDQRERLTVQDTYIMPDFPYPYEEALQYWRHFNYTYIVLYPPEREAEVLALLGPHADTEYNFRHAAERASEEIFTSTGRKAYFAWFNRGTSLMRLQDYAGAAQAYDQAFQVYATLDPEIRPWRMLWYQTGPYFAYYYTGRYQDVINLATNILTNMDKPIHEESFYWRALAKEALGDTAGAIEDLRASLEVHPGFAPSLAQLERLGAAP
jgi:hypothetical protein